MNEDEMREFEVPYYHTLEEVIEFVKSLETQANEYGTAAYCASLAATAMFNYICHREGLTGFQALCADLDILRRTRMIKGPFIILKLDDAMYPQYNLREKLESFLTDDSSLEWMRETAIKNLDENPDAHPAVISHWRELTS